MLEVASPFAVTLRDHTSLRLGNGYPPGSLLGLQRGLGEWYLAPGSKDPILGF